MAFLGRQSLNFWTKHLKFCIQVPKCKENIHAKFQLPARILSVTFLPKNLKNNPNRSPKGNMWSAIPVALLCMIVNLCEGKQGSGPEGDKVL